MLHRFVRSHHHPFLLSDLFCFIVWLYFLRSDSVFVKFCPSILSLSPEAYFKRASDISEEITKVLFKPPISLEFEKIYNPLLLMMKKKYCGMKIEGAYNSKPSRDSKGVILKRRDNCMFVRELYSDIMDLLLQQGEAGVAMCLKRLEETLCAMFGDSIPLDKFGITKTIKGSYANENLPQAKVAANKRARGEDVRSNDRVTYVIVADQQHLKKRAPPVAQRAEDIEYFRANMTRKNPMKLDYQEYYINSQLRQPIEQLLGIVVPVSTIDAIIEKAKRANSHKCGIAAKRAIVGMFERAAKRQAV